MPDRASMLNSSTFCGIQSLKVVSILALPEIDRRDFPDLPDDMEMRLLTPANGADPSIVLFHPQTEMHLEVPVVEMNNLAPYVARVRGAVEQFSMGVPPDA
jgi:hypothetical protein